MNTTPSVPHSRSYRTATAALLAVVVLFFAGCATVAPTEDKIVVNTERALRIGDALYRDGMAYYFTPGVAEAMGPATVRTFEKIRTGFDPVYKDVQGALDAYKATKTLIAAGKAGDLGAAAIAVREAVTKLAALVNQVLGLVPVPQLTKSLGNAVQAGGV